MLKTQLSPIYKIERVLKCKSTLMYKSIHENVSTPSTHEYIYVDILFKQKSYFLCLHDELGIIGKIWLSYSQNIILGVPNCLESFQEQFYRGPKSDFMVQII